MATTADQSKQVLLQVKGLKVAYGGIQAVKGVDLEVREGELVTLIGSNGAGKTTVFNQLSGFIQPSSGQVKVRTAAGQWLTPSSPAQFAVAGIGRTFQIVQPFADLSVCENIMLGAFMHTRDPVEARQIATKVAALTDLGPLLDTRARNLTVGGMKRLEMARALATRPRVLLLDEVMAGLNPTDVGKAIEIIRRVRDTGVSVLMIEHIMQATMTLSDRIVVISTGAVLMAGEPQAVVTNPQVIEAYLGKEYDHAAA